MCRGRESLRMPTPNAAPLPITVSLQRRHVPHTTKKSRCSAPGAHAVFISSEFKPAAPQPGLRLLPHPVSPAR
eukprot:364836-Chlamydomonas_euryale.AAC.18